METDAILSNWWLDEDGYIHGKIWFDRLETGMHPFANGEVVRTNRILHIKEKIATTLSGSRYLLI